MSRPASRTLRRAAIAGGLLAGLAIPSAASAADSSAVVLTTDNKISTFETAYPTEATAPVAVTDNAGNALTDKLVGIDVRPQNGALYALGRNATAGTLQLYVVSVRTGVATAVGTPLVQGGTAAATEFGFDFNPKVDRIRVTSDAGLNLRINPNDGALAAADPALNGGTAKLDGAAYTNDQQDPEFTTLYGLNAADGKLYRSLNPNTGELAAGKTVTSALGPVAFGAVGGFDIAPNNDVTGADNAEAAAGKVGYAAVKVGTLNLLLKVDLNTAVASIVGTVGNGATAVQGLAVREETKAGGLPAVSLDAITGGGQGIRRFDTATPATGKTTAAITGITAGETLVGIDWRPATGQLIGLGVNPASGAESATLYRIDPQTGAATVIGAAASLIKFVAADGTTAVDLPASGYDIDVNPTVDRVRVVTSSGLNFRVNPDTGVGADGNNGKTETADVALQLGTNTDGDQNPAGSFVSGTAYTNSFGQRLPVAPSTTPLAPTTQYGISAANDQLQIQTPPNLGTQTAGKPLGVDATAVNGFDIPAGITSAPAAAAAAGSGLAALTVGGAGGLYSVNLTSGAATLKGALTVTPTSFAVGDGPAPAKARPTTPPATGGGTPPVTTPPATSPTKPPVIVAPTKPATFGSSTRLTVKLRSTRARRNGPAKVQFRNTNAFSVRVRLQATTPKSGKRKAIRYATKTYTVKRSASRTINLRLPSAARKVLQSKKRLTIKVTLRITDPAGKSRTVRKTLTLRLTR